MDIATAGVDVLKMLISLVVGFCLGWLARGYRDKMRSGIDNEKVIALLVTGVWALSVIFDMISASYETPVALHGLMGGIVGFYYKNTLQKKNGKH